MKTKKILFFAFYVAVIIFCLYGNFFINVCKNYLYSKKYVEITCVLSGEKRLYPKYPLNICVNFDTQPMPPFASNTVLPSINKNLVVGQHVQIKEVEDGIPLTQRVPFNFRSNNIFAFFNN